MNKKPLLDINLITWQGENYLGKLLQSIFNQSFKDFSLLIIDNNSSDNTVSFLKENYPQVKVINNKINLGFAKAHNQAINWTAGKYVLCLNQDTVLEKNFLKNALAFMEKNSEAAAITGKILVWDYQNNLPTKQIDSLGLKILKNHRVLDRGQGETDTGQYEEINEVFGVSGAAPIFRREVLEKLKYNYEYFDENFFSYKEDVDLAFRLKLGGYKTFYLPKAIIYHQRSSGLSINSASKHLRSRRRRNKYINYHSYKNHFFVLLKNEFLLNVLKYFPWLVAYELKKLFYLLFFEQRTLKSFGEIIRLLPLMLKKRKYIKKNITLIKPTELGQWYE